MCKGKKDCGCGCNPQYGGYTRPMLTYAAGGVKKLRNGGQDTEPDPPETTGGLPPLPVFNPQDLGIAPVTAASDAFFPIQTNLDLQGVMPLQTPGYTPRTEEEIAEIEQRAAERASEQAFEESVSAQRIDEGAPGETRQQGLERAEAAVQQRMDELNQGSTIRLTDYTSRKDIALLQAFLGSQGYNLNTADRQFTNYTAGQNSLSGTLFGQDISIEKGKQGYDGKIGAATRKAVQDYNENRGNQRQQALVDLGYMTEEEQQLYQSTGLGEQGERCTETGCAEFSAMELSRATGIPREELRSDYGLTGDAWQIITNAINAGGTQLYSNPAYIDPHSSSAKGRGFTTDFSSINGGDLVAIKYGSENRLDRNVRLATGELGIDSNNAYTHSAVVDSADIDTSGNGTITIVHNVHDLTEDRTGYIGKKYKDTFTVKNGVIQNLSGNNTDHGGTMRIMQIVDVLGDQDRESLSFGLVTSEIGKPANYDNYSTSQQLTLDRMTESLNNKDFSAALLDEFPTLSEDELNGLKQATMGIGAQETELSGAFGGNLGRYAYEEAASAARHSADVDISPIPGLPIRIGELYRAITGKDLDPITGSVGPTSIKVGEEEGVRDAETNPFGRVALEQGEIDFLNREGDFNISTGSLTDKEGAAATLYILARDYNYFKQRYPDAEQGVLLGYAIQAYNSGRGIASSVPVEELGITRKEYVEQRDSDYVNKVYTSAVQFPITSDEGSLNTILDREVRENPIVVGRGQTRRTVEGERDELFDFVPAIDYRAYGGLVGKDSGSGQLDYNPNMEVSTSAFDAGQSTIGVDTSALEGTTKEKIKDVGRTVAQATVGTAIGATEALASMAGADIDIGSDIKFGEMTQGDLDTQQKVGRVAQTVGSAGATVAAGVLTGNPQLIARGARKTFDNLGDVDPNSQGLQTVSNVGQAGAQIYGMVGGTGQGAPAVGGGAPIGTTAGVDAAGNAVSYAPGANPEGTGTAFGDIANQVGSYVPMQAGGLISYQPGGPVVPLGTAEVSGTQSPERKQQLIDSLRKERQFIYNMSKSGELDPLYVNVYEDNAEKLSLLGEDVAAIDRQIDHEYKYRDDIRKYKERIREADDSLGEDVLEVFDPTGLATGLDDAKAAQASMQLRRIREGKDPYKYVINPLDYTAGEALDIVGALPLVGKFGKAAKGGEGLVDFTKQAPDYVKRLGRALDAAGFVQDRTQENPESTDESYKYGGGLRRWFKEEWKDVKTGKPCGRKSAKGSSRPYPYCRPSKRVSSKTPATTSHKEAKSRAGQKTGPKRVKPIMRKRSKK